jgi:hypothetical protein
MSSTKIALRDRLTMIAAQARLISLAATGLNKNGTLGDGDLTGVVELADRIEQQLIDIADEIRQGEPDESGIAASPNQPQRLQSLQPTSPLRASRRR